MNRLQRSGLIAAAIAALCAGVSVATPELGVAPIIQHLKDCRAKTDDHERLVCYDAVVSDLIAGAQQGSVMVVDREQARAVRRQAFGFDLSALSIFDRMEKPAEINRVTATVKSAYQHADGRWVLEMQDGAVWEQTDDEPVQHPAKAGSKAEIRKAALGSYFLNLDGQRAIHAKRVK